MHVRVLMPRETDKPRLALLFRTIQCFKNAASSVGEFRIVIEGHPVNLPEIEMVGLQPSQGFFQHGHGQGCTAPMRADLGHQEDLVPTALETAPEPILCPAVPVLPTVVEKRDSRVDRLMDQLDRKVDGLGVAQMVATHSECGNLYVRPSERPLRNLTGTRPAIWRRTARRTVELSGEPCSNCRAPRLDAAIPAACTKRRRPTFLTDSSFGAWSAMQSLRRGRYDPLPG